MVKLNPSPNHKAKPPAPLSPALQLSDARLFNLYDAAEPGIDDVVISADAIEAMLEAGPELLKKSAATK